MPRDGPRVEDDFLLRGHGRFVADAPRAGPSLRLFRALAARLRPHPHDRHAAAARGAPRACSRVLTAADMQAAGVGNIGRASAAHRPRRQPSWSCRTGRRSPRAGHACRRAGGAWSIAESAAAAQDAAELVAVDYEELHAGDRRCAPRSQPGAPQVWPEAPGNIALDWPGLAADPDANARRGRRASSSRRQSSRACRWSTSASSSPRWSRAAPPRATTRPATAIRCASARRAPASCATTSLAIMGSPKERLRVITEDVGGAFGLKTGAYPEYLALLVGAKTIGRPVHWMSSRAEAFLSDNQARDTCHRGGACARRQGQVPGAAHPQHSATWAPIIGSVGAQRPDHEFHALFSRHVRHPAHRRAGALRVHQHAADRAYRGAGRPEANYMLERLVDEAARVTGIDPIKLRRRNLIPASAMPYKTAVGTTYDSGDFAPCSTRRWRSPTTPASRSASAKRQGAASYRGIGISCLLEHAGGSPIEGARLTFPGDGTLAARAQRAVDRPGPRHGLPAAGRRAARHRAPSKVAPPARRFGARHRRAAPRSARARR